jgi:hypothetical protein
MMASFGMHALERRADAAQATLAHFRDQPFVLGRHDCARLVNFHLRAIGRPLKHGKAGSYETVLGARRALRRLGFADLPSLMDAHFDRIAPAAALVADVVALPAEHPLGSLTVALGNGRVLGWHEDVPGAAVLQPEAFVAAWRILPIG